MVSGHNKRFETEACRFPREIFAESYILCKILFAKDPVKTSVQNEHYFEPFTINLLTAETRNQ